MKKTLFMLLAASALASCSQDEVLEATQKEAISFNDAFVENATRAIDATYSNSNKPSSFVVYGNTKGDEQNAVVVPIFNGVTVSNNNNTTGVGSDYKYDANYTQYWINGNTYNFAAVVDGNTITTGTDGLPTTITYDATNQKDLLYATAKATGAASGNQAVGFTFNHLLSKAMFTVVNEMANNTANATYFYRVSDVQINNAYKTGTYTVGQTSTWNTVETDNTIVVDFGNVNNADDTSAETATEIGMNSSATSHYQRVLIPAAYSTSTRQLNITCTIETLIKQTGATTNDVTYAVINTENYNKSIDYTFAPGTAYNFKITLGNPGEAIEFTVSAVDEWGTPTDKEIYKENN